MGLGTDGRLHRLDRRRLRRSGGRHLPRCRAGQRGRRLRLERARHRDPAAAKEFYGAVFGWDFEDQDMGEIAGDLHRLEGRRRDGSVAWPTSRARVPDEVPANWFVYFSLEDADGAAGEDGGPAVAGSCFGPLDIPVSRFAVRNRPIRCRLRGDGTPSPEFLRTPAPRSSGAERRGFRRIAGLALVLPIGGLAEAGALDDLEAEHRALHAASPGNSIPEQLEHELLRQPQHLLRAICPTAARASTAKSPQSRSRTPCPRRRSPPGRSPWSSRMVTCCSSPQKGLVSSNSRSGSSSVAEVVRAACSARGSGRDTARPSPPTLAKGPTLA